MSLAESAPILAAPPRPPKRLPWWRAIWATRANAISTWTDAAFEVELIESKFLNRHVFVANAPDLVEHVMVGNVQNYRRPQLGQRILQPGLGLGLLTSEGEVWRRQRRMMSPAFAPRKVNDFAPAMIRHAQRLSAEWEKGPRERDLLTDLSTTTLGIICEAMFSVVDDPEMQRIADTVTRYQDTMRPAIADLLGFPEWFPRASVKRARKMFAETDRVIWRLVEERRREGGPDDLLTALVSAAEAGNTMPKEEVRDHVATILTAGHETTANALVWTFYLLAMHPAIEAKLHAELDRVLEGRDPTLADVAELTYTKMVLEESMRLYPPVHTTSREAIEPDRFRDTPVPAGSTILIVPWLLHRHRLLWDEPERFRPERFAPEASVGRHRCAWMPFGAGPRICIGASFAMLEAILVLATLARKWKPRLAAGAKIEPLGLITLRPKNGMPMVIEPR